MLGSSFNARCSWTLHPKPYTLHPTPYTLHQLPNIQHSTPCTLHPTLYTLQDLLAKVERQRALKLSNGRREVPLDHRQKYAIVCRELRSLSKIEGLFVVRGVW